MLAPLCLLLSSFTGCASLDVRNAPPPSSATALKQQKHIAVIGAGFSGLTAACELAQLGYDVTLFDKHAEVGGRARTFTTESGFTFDYGPSWYWMPGIFDHVFARYGKKVKEYYNLTLLDPAYRVELPTGVVDVPGTYEGILDLAKERGGEDADLALRLFFDEAEEKFEQGVYDFIWKPMVSFTELIDTALMRAGLELDMFSGFASHLSRFTKDPLIHMLLKWPVIFIGASPDDAASMYSLMTYAGHVRGTWYPDGGLGAPAKALASIAEEMGVNIRLASEVTELRLDPTDPERIGAVCATGGDCTEVDGVLAAADYEWVEQKLLPPHLQRYDTAFWDRQVLSPSTILFYLGFDQRLPGLLHHTFFFDEELDAHLDHVFAREPPRGEYARQPTFYVSATSKTDSLVQPANNSAAETVFVLIPIHHLLNGTATTEVRAAALEMVLTRMQTRMRERCGAEATKEAACGPEQDLRAAMVYSRSYGPEDFEADHHSFRGNAFGLANTLAQSLILKPSLDAKATNMAFAGHLTSPGPGVPPSLVSGIVAAGVLHQKMLHPNAKQSFVVEMIEGAATMFISTPLGVWLFLLIGGTIVCLFVLRPLCEAMLTLGLCWLLAPPNESSSPFKQGTLSMYDLLLRTRAYMRCAELLYRNGRTYFCAATLMHAQCFFDTAANYALFRVADDFVDNDDERMRASEQDSKTGRILPEMFAEGCATRGKLLDQFEADFWRCWNTAHNQASGKGGGMTLAEMGALHPVFPAVIESSLRVGFKKGLYERFFKAMRSDTQAVTPVAKAAVAKLRGSKGCAPGTKFFYVGKVCRTMQEMLDYMDGSAAVIGDFMVPLLMPMPKRTDFDSDTAFSAAVKAVEQARSKALPHAQSLGNAFQITNFLRDIDEDTRIARQYIPVDICAKHGIHAKVMSASKAVAAPTPSSHPSSVPATTDYSKLKVVELKKLCKKRNLPVSGKKAVLIQRLSDDGGDVVTDESNERFVGYPLDRLDHAGGLYAQKGFVPLMEEMLCTTEAMYIDADLGIKMLGAAEPIINVARCAYAKIHDKIREGDYKIYDTRFRVPITEKLKVARTILPTFHVVHIAVVEVVCATIVSVVETVRLVATSLARYIVPLLAFMAVLAVTSAPAAPGAFEWGVLSTPTWAWTSIVQHMNLDTLISSTPVLSRFEECTYADFHMLFTLPFLAVVWGLALLNVRGRAEGVATLRATLFWAGVLCVVASLYTLPWDDYLVANAVWWYGEGRVMLEYLIGHTPFEECAFFSLQTIIIAGLWLLWFNKAEKDHSVVMCPPLNLPAKDVRHLTKVRRLGYFALATMQLVGLALFNWQIFGSQGTYFGLILVWATPVLAVQWIVGAEALADNARPLLELITFASWTLSLMDRWAIRRGIWAISEEKATLTWVSSALLGPHLPLEEAFFFFITACMCVGGLTLAVITTKAWKEGSSGGFCSTLIIVHHWGTGGQHLHHRGQGRSVKKSSTQSTLYSALLVVATLGSVLALVAHRPVWVVTQLQHALAVQYGEESATVALRWMPALRSARLVQLLCSVAVIVSCLRSIERNDRFRHALVVLALNASFICLDPVFAFPVQGVLLLLLRLAPQEDSDALGKWSKLHWRSPFNLLPHGFTGMVSMLTGLLLVAGALSGSFELHRSPLLFVYVLSTMMNATAGVLIASKAPSKSRELFRAAGVYQAALAYYALRFSAGQELSAALPASVLRVLDCAVPLLLLGGLSLFVRGAFLQKEKLMTVCILVACSTLCLLSGYPVQLALGGEEWWTCVQSVYPQQAVGFSGFVYVPATWCFGAILFGATLFSRKIISLHQFGAIFLTAPPLLVAITVLIQEVHIPIVSTQKLLIFCPAPEAGSLAAWLEDALDFSKLAQSVLSRVGLGTINLLVPVSNAAVGLSF